MFKLSRYDKNKRYYKRGKTLAGAYEIFWNSFEPNRMSGQKRGFNITDSYQLSCSTLFYSIFFGEEVFDWDRDWCWLGIWYYYWLRWKFRFFNVINLDSPDFCSMIDFSSSFHLFFFSFRNYPHQVIPHQVIPHQVIPHQVFPHQVIRSTLYQSWILFLFPFF